MALIIGLVLGFVLAAVLFYFFSQSQIAAKNEALQRSRNQLQQLEQNHNQRLKTSTLQLQQDYDQRLADGIAEARSQVQKAHEAETMTLKAQATAAKAEVVTLRADATASEAEANAANAEVTNLKGEVTRLKAKIDQLQHPVTTNQTETLSPPVDKVSEGTIAAAPTLSPTSAQPKKIELPSPSTGLPHLISQATEPDSAQRQQVATALKAILQQPLRAETKQVVPLLTKLCQDNDPAVRLSAVQALAETRSRQAIPLLKRALRDPDMAVVAAASQAMDRFKVYPKAIVSSKVAKAKKKLPKNR